MKRNIVVKPVGSRAKAPPLMMDSIPVDEFNETYDLVLKAASEHKIDLRKSGADTSRMQVITFVVRELARLLSTDEEFRKLSEAHEKVKLELLQALRSLKESKEAHEALQIAHLAHIDLTDNLDSIQQEEIVQLNDDIVRQQEEIVQLKHQIQDRPPHRISFDLNELNSPVVVYTKDTIENSGINVITDPTEEEEKEMVNTTEEDVCKEKATLAERLMGSVEKNMECHLTPVQKLEKKLAQEISTRAALVARLDRAEKKLQELESEPLVEDSSPVKATGNDYQDDYQYLQGKIDAYEFVLSQRGTK